MDVKSTTTPLATDVDTTAPLDEQLKTQLGALELDVLTSTYLSDLVRGGSAVIGQARGTFVADNGDRCFHATLHAALQAQGHLRG